MKEPASLTRRVFLARCARIGVATSLGPAMFASEKIKGQRVFSCGHSFHVFVYRMVAEMAKAAGIEDHQLAGLSAIGGSHVIQHWDVPEDMARAVSLTEKEQENLNRFLQEIAWQTVNTKR